MSETDIYNLLTGVQIEDATTTQLNSATGRTFIDTASRDFWHGVLTLNHVIKAARTYAHGLPIPEASAMQTVTVADSASGTIKPTGTEVWQVQTVALDNCTAFLTDGSGIQLLYPFGDATSPTHQGPLYLTNTLYIGFSNASGSEQTPGLSYHKVSL